MIDVLTKALRADRGLLRKRARRGGHVQVFRHMVRASAGITGGEYDSAYQHMEQLSRQVRRANETQTRHIRAMMGDLAAAYVRLGNFERAVRVYEEMLLLGRYLPPRYTGAALNKLIGTHMDLGEHETALMYVRVGIAVLDDVGVGPYRAMDRIIREMSSPEPAVNGLEHDFDAALDRLESSVAEAKRRGLIVENQWWAPVYLARHDREEAIRILKALLAPMRGDPGDILRDPSLHEQPVQ